MRQISKPFHKQLSKVHLNMLCYENVELKSMLYAPHHFTADEAAASFLMKYPLSQSFQPK